MMNVIKARLAVNKCIMILMDSLSQQGILSNDQPEEILQFSI